MSTIEAEEMALSERAQELMVELNKDGLKMGDLRGIAKQIKKDHELAKELWSTGDFHPRLLATLIFDPKLLSEGAIDQLATDLLRHEGAERSQLVDWLLANQLSKDKKLVTLMTTWEHHPSPVMRRLFWYHQARLRWVGQVPPENTEELMNSLEKGLASEDPDVQWAMNFCAGQIGVHDARYRSRCIQLGENLGLYKDERVPRGCTPSYLPEFIRIEVAKRA